MPTGENALVAWLTARFAAEPHAVPIGIGDDMAAVRLAGDLVLITADMLLDGVHFDATRHAPELIGRKAIACSLSDCAGMGCRPRGATVSLALPTGMAFEAVQRFYEGAAGVADKFGCPIIGGDTTSWAGKLAIDVAMLAEPMAARGPIRRSDARPGDSLYVSGRLGGSITGRHLTFAPRLELAARLAPNPAVHAMMDISDGISMDLHRLCNASGCDAELDGRTILDSAVSPEALALARQDGQAPIDHALSDGEDFELLIAGDAGLDGEAPDLIPVGRILSRREADRSQMWLIEPNGVVSPLAPKGYEHFK